MTSRNVLAAAFCSLAVMAAATPLAGQERRSGLRDPLRPPDLQRDRPEAPRSIAASTEQTRLLFQLRQDLAQPFGDVAREQVGRRLDRLVEDAAALALSTDPGPLRMAALNVKMQALYLRIHHWPQDPLNDRRLEQLHSAARHARSMDMPEAPAIGDFWLMTADLLRVNQTLDLPPDQRQRRAQTLLSEYVRQHRAGPTAEAARAALDEMDRLLSESDSGAAGPIDEDADEGTGTRPQLPGAEAGQPSQQPDDEPSHRTPETSRDREGAGHV